MTYPGDKYSAIICGNDVDGAEGGDSSWLAGVVSNISFHIKEDLKKEVPPLIFLDHDYSNDTLSHFKVIITLLIVNTKRLYCTWESVGMGKLAIC